MSGKKLLVADDSLTIQKVIRLALSHEGYEIQAVSDGNEAIEQLLLFRPHVVLIDVSLPGKSATEVKALADEKSELRDVKFVLMSSAFEQVDDAAIARVGFHGRLTKPFDPAHLRKVLQDSLGQMNAAPEAADALSSFAPAAELPSPPPLDLPPWTPPRLEPSRPKFDAPSAPPPPFQSPSPPTFAPPPAAPASVAVHENETDIRELTQSTLKMAGFDDLDWTVNEGAMKDSFQGFEREPSLPPLPKMNQEAFTPPSSLPNFDTLTSVSIQAPAPASEAATAPLNSFMTEPFNPLDALQGKDPLQPSNSFQGMDSYQIEALVQRQVEEALTRMSRELLPEIAERLIKAEIHRLLTEGP